MINREWWKDDLVSVEDTHKSHENIGIIHVIEPPPGPSPIMLGSELIDDESEERLS